MYMSTIRDQHYFGGALLDVGFADTRGLLRNPVRRATALYEITPLGNRGNYFSGVDRHFYRQQSYRQLFLPVLHWRGAHHLKFGVDVERESFHQITYPARYQVLRDDVRLRASDFFRAVVPAAQESGGRPLRSGSLDAARGARARRRYADRMERDRARLEVAPRVSVTWAPHRLADTKLSAGWGIYTTPSAWPPSPASRTRTASPPSTCRTALCSDR